MTTYNGRSAQFVPGRETPNKEPPMNRFVIEKLYRVHRERMIKIEPLVDCHVYIPEFMKGSNTWKKNAAEARQNRILAENAHMYGRIDKVEKSESLYIKEQRQHIRRMETKGHYLRRLKETDRVHRIMKIQKENEYMLKRIEKAQPSLGKPDDHVIGATVELTSCSYTNCRQEEDAAVVQVPPVVQGWQVCMMIMMKKESIVETTHGLF